MPDFYAQAVGSLETRPVIRVNRFTNPPTRWCPFCDHSSQVNLATCPGCGALWLDAALVYAENRVSAALGRSLNLPVAPTPPTPTFPEHVAGGGFGEWTNEQLAEGADKARIDGDVDLLLELAQEMEDRHREAVAKAVEPVIPQVVPDDESTANALQEAQQYLADHPQDDLPAAEAPRRGPGRPRRS